MSTSSVEPALNARSYTSRLTSRGQINLMTALAFVFTLVIGLIVIGLAERSRVLEAKAAASNTASGYVNTIQERLARSLSATYALAAVLKQGNGRIENFEQLGRQMLAVYGGISSLQLAENGIISAIVPHAGNEKAFGHNLLEDTSRNKEARLAVSSRELTLAGPFDLIQGGTGVVGRLPVFLPGTDAKEHFWGFTTALIGIPDLLQSSKLGNLSEQGYRYQLWRIHPDRNTRQVIKSTDESPFTDPVETAFDVPNGKWTLSVEPVNGWHSPWRIAAQTAAAGLVAALFSLLTNILLTQPLRLRNEVDARTRELREANQILGSEIITREKAETALRLSRFSLEQASDALYWINRNGQIIDVNTAACRTLGYSREELLQLSIPDIYANYDAATWSAHWAELQREGALTFESIQCKKDGSAFPVEVVANHVCFAGEEFNCAFVREITERKKNELDLRIAAIAFESQEGMVVTDADNRILRVNRAFSQITGYSAEEVMGKTPAVLRSGRQDELFYRNMWQELIRNKYWAGEIWNRRKDGEIYPEWMTITAVTDEHDNITHYIGAFSDTSGRIAAESQIRNLAFYDHLTKLANRRLLADRLQQAIAASDRKQGHGALLFLDLDNFKTLNDTKGHETGDRMLIEVANRLKDCVRETDTVARVGGDEFAIVLQDLGGTDKEAAIQAEKVVENILKAIRHPYDLGGIEHHSTASIGISLFADPKISIEELFKRADTAMYQAKNSGRNAGRFFDPAMQAALENRMALEADLRRAVAQKEFELYYQLQVDTRGHPIGAEALIRWRQSNGELVSPATFIPLAEETGLIVPIGQWVLETACSTLHQWQEYPLTRDLQIAVNVSARQFRDDGFVKGLAELIETSAICPEKLKLELTESIVLDNVDDVIMKMRTVREMGVIFSMDDFGTGYSSLCYLQQLPLAQLKIDQSFVRDLAEDSNDAAIVRAVITLGKTLGLHVIAEGVETEAQLTFLVEHGCHAFQGYLFSHPLPEKQFLTKLNSLSIQ